MADQPALRVQSRNRRFRLATLAVLLGAVVLCTAVFALTTVWTRTVNGSADGSDFGSAIAQAPNGDIYVVGAIDVTGQNRNIWIRKYKDNGSKLWTRTVNGPFDGYDAAFDVIVDSTGDLYVVGHLAVGFEDYDIWIRKYDYSGAKLWTRKVDGPASGYDRLFGAAMDSADNLYAVGYIKIAGGDANIWIRKYNSSGGKIWTRTVDGPAAGWDYAMAAAVDSSDNLYVVGTVELVDDTTNIWIRKYDSSGKKLWTRTVDGPEGYYDRASGVAVDSVGNLIVVGYISVDGAGHKIWTRKYSPSGNKLWTRTFSSGDGYDEASDVAVDSSDAIYVIGEKDPAGPPVAWIRKYSTNGVKRWTTTYDGPDDLWGRGSGITISSTKRVYATGSTSMSDEDNNIWVRKYAQ